MRQMLWIPGGETCPRAEPGPLAHLDGKVDEATDVEGILHQVKDKLHMLHKRQVVRHPQGKTGDLLQDIARYLRAESMKKHLLLQRSAQQTHLTPSQEAALSDALGWHSQGQADRNSLPAPYLRGDLVLVKVRKVLELSKDILSCWKCFWLAPLPLLAFLPACPSGETPEAMTRCPSWTQGQPMNQLHIPANGLAGTPVSCKAPLTGVRHESEDEEPPVRNDSKEGGNPQARHSDHT